MDQFKLGAMEQRFADLIWGNSPIPTRELTELCMQEFNWKRTTTYTMLKRLCQRNLFENRGGTVVSLMSRDEYYVAQSQQLLGEAFSGSLPMFVAAFTRRNKLSSKEIGELQQLIDEYKED